MTAEVEQVVRGGLDTTNQFAAKLKHDPGAIAGARDGHVALQTSVGQVRDQAGARRSNLANAASGHTADRAAATSQDMEKEIQDLLDESAEIENAVAEAAETLHVGEIRDDQVRDQIVREIAASMKALRAVNGIQPPQSRAAAARQILLQLQTKIGQLTGQAATFSEQTITQLTSPAVSWVGPTPRPPARRRPLTCRSRSTATAPTPVVAVGETAAAVLSASHGCRWRSRRSRARGVDINLPGGRTVKAPNETAAKAVRAALSQLGVPYVWGGTARGQGWTAVG